MQVKKKSILIKSKISFHTYIFVSYNILAYINMKNITEYSFFCLLIVERHNVVRILLIKFIILIERVKKCNT